MGDAMGDALNRAMDDAMAYAMVYACHDLLNGSLHDPCLPWLMPSMIHAFHG